MAELTPKQQVVEILKNSKNFLILTHTDPDGDALGSALAAYLTLKKLGKEATIVGTDKPGVVFSFLPSLNDIKTSMTSFRDFIISLDISQVHADKVMYRKNGDKLEFIVTPKNGNFDEKMVAFPQGNFNFDAVIVLDCPDIERIGNLYDENPDIFFETPVVNIDHHAGNSHFGKINLVDLTATSTAEILVSVFEALTGDPKFFDENIATALLTGIITDTNSFQNTNTTPKSLTVAAQLVALGGRQQEIIKNIYKTKPLSTLRLWGRALSNLRDEKGYRFVWTAIYKKDYLEVGAAEDESSGLIDELLKTASGVDFALLLSEKNGDVHGSLRAATKSANVSQIAEMFGGGGHPMAAGFELKDNSLEGVSSQIIQKLRDFQKSKTLKDNE